MSQFKTFADQINARFKALQKQRDLFVSSASGDELYAAYLDAFPVGTNPIFRERTEHDCSNCRAFIRNFGGVVSINPVTLSLETIWDGDSFEGPYAVVAARMRKVIGERAVGGLFRVGQASFSAQKTHTEKAGAVETYHHFYGVAERQFVTRDGAQAGEHQTSVQVLADGLGVITLDALDTVLGLIEDKQLYRGEEHRNKLVAFRETARMYAALEPAQHARFIALMAPNLGISRFKNSVIGTLVVDLAEGQDLEDAVRSFEAKVAPTNYQRTQQVVSQRMIDDALKVIEELGLNVGRRMARIEDVSVNNVLWASGEAAPLMKDGLAGLLAGAATRKPVVVDEQRATDIGIEQFLTEVMPGATALRVLVSGDLQNNFMTLTTSDGEPGPHLFRWNNPFAWSYAGGATDMISERVKAAGGNIRAALRFSLSWTNTDDLDLRLTYRGRGTQTLYFGDKTSRIPGLVGGLDVDMNAFNLTRTPVENIAFTRLLPGEYAVAVNNYHQREKIDGGFILQVADGVGVTEYHHPANVPNRQTIDCLTATVDAQGGVTYQIGAALRRGTTQVTGQKWGVAFGQYAEVSAVMRSPNHWDGNETGNKHTFFILKDARADEQPRGIYNEYLNPELARHRKVLDLIGEKTKPVLTDQQLSGIGVSSTLRKSMIVEVASAASRRPYRIQF